MLLEARLVDELLDITRIHHGKLELQPEVVDVEELLALAGDVCRALAAEHSVSIEFDARARQHRVRGDPARLQQVFWNLIQNAIKFTPAGGRVTLRTVNPEPEQLLVCVEDTGVGIAAEDLPKLFLPFEQVGMRAVHAVGGLGLGLAICKALVEAHAGAIEVRSPGRGQGATFCVTLPTTDERAAPPDRAAAAPVPAPPRALRILLAEDHADTRRVLAQILGLEGHSVEAVESVAEALEAAERSRFDLLVSDVGLPDGSGMDLMRTLRAREITVPGIALSGYGTPADMAASLAAGFTAHLVKPVDLDRLLEAVDQARLR